MNLNHKLSKLYIHLRFYRRYGWLRFQYYFWFSLTIPARIYCFVRGYNYKDWVWKGRE